MGHRCKNIFKRQNVEIVFKKPATLAIILRNPITKGSADSLRGVVYQIPCKIGCPKQYIGETGREFEVRLDEHKKGVVKARISSKLVEHALYANHEPDWDKKKLLWKNVHKKGKVIPRGVGDGKNQT